MIKFLPLLFILVIAACGPLPRPFMAQEPDSNPLLQLENTRPLAVEPPIFQLKETNLETTDLTLWAQDNLSQALRDQDLPAANDAFASNSLHLYSSFETERVAGNQILLSLKVRITETTAPDRFLIELEEKTKIPRIHLKKNPKSVLTELIKRASQNVSHKIAQLDQETGPQPQTADYVSIQLASLPDDLDTRTKKVLENELRASFQIRKLYLTRQTTEAFVYKLKLKIDLSKQNEQGFLSLLWSLEDSANGEEIGQISQTNPIPNLPLSRILIPASEAIAEGTAMGIKDLLQQKSLQNQTVLK
ncbi:hypothetical protein WH96_01585 [Kiloniella spongiae]|uniref:Lipoprotein n=1 Tax=Kiloniella spongiae TaxID=1489064 RepID=A0A0H2MN77_9PROT|nr:hypothetical protein [Kiloniella spongiae]KLN62242.1 hypothetical protein WH96_01585 [Kiloniella spongiae]